MTNNAEQAPTEGRTIPAEEGHDDATGLHRPELEVHLPNPEGMDLQSMRNRVSRRAREGLYDKELRSLDQLGEKRER